MHELRKKYPEAEIRFWCDRAFEVQARNLMRGNDGQTRVEVIVSGKFRRYHAMPIWKQLLRIRTIVWPNFRDLFMISVGVIQSLVKLLIWRPDVVFTKGGFVCLPIGLAARLLGIKLVIHDSDAHPGLTNRILARWAAEIATGAPTEYYPYDKTKMHYVGIPIQTRQPAEAEERAALKQKLGFDPERPLLVVTGGGLGAKRINDATADCLPDLLESTSVALISGVAQYEELVGRLGENTANFQLHAFVAKDFADFLAAADLVVSRAGATTLLELAALEKPSIIIPNIHLTGGHQQKNAQVYLDSDAIMLLDEKKLDDDSQLLTQTVTTLLDDPSRMDALGQAIGKFTKPSAASDVADLITKQLKVRA